MLKTPISLVLIPLWSHRISSLFKVCSICLGFTIGNTYLSSFMVQAPKTLRISCNESNKDIFCYVHEVTFGLYLSVGAGHQENQSHVYRVGPFGSTSHHHLREGRGTGDWDHYQWPMTSSTIICSKVFRKPQKDRVWRASRLVSLWRCWRGDGSSEPLPTHFSLTSFPSGCSYYPSI